MTLTVALTDEQRRVVEMPADATVLVTAGPGTGKTHTLVHRIAHLLEDGEVAGYELLVLTFSRAAVGTLTARLRDLGGDPARVRVRTFDSWALEILREVGREPDGFDGDFDRRIREATAVLADDTQDVLRDLRHVVVDEVQDLVAARRRLVRTLLAEFECGFTLVGDLAQSIYGFQIGRDGEQGSFVDDLRSLCPSLTELRLDEDFRFRTGDSRRALKHGDDLRRADLPQRRLRSLRDTFESLDPIGAIDDALALSMLAEPQGSTAVLCRTNGEALVVAEILRREGVRHRLRRSSTDRMAPGWLAEIAHRTQGTSLTRERFESLADRLALTSPDMTWSQLLRVGGDRGRRVVDLVQVRDAVRDGRLPDELVAEPAADVVVSSFHRAKGLEFDVVVVVDPCDYHWQHLEPADSGEEARLLFVAMTRSREQLWSAAPVRSPQVRRAAEVARWARYGWQPWQRLGLEGGSGDVTASLPGLHGDPAPADRAQDDVTARIGVGDAVEMVRMDTVVPDGEAPEYVVMYEGEPVGAASRRFREHLRTFLQRGSRSRVRSYPDAIQGFRVDGIETVVEGDAAGREAGLNDLGLRRVPRLVGLSWFDYPKGGTDD
ncbi:UvrD-helicase domain-containing protein [Actinomycetospora sp. CA-084318]|uniref:UvrD-helicase domain-containing protein n=1 Tax=Actinomycetospora sp. CA-084318 TaxID=3239892 RepID=UPI003D96E9E7